MNKILINILIITIFFSKQVYTKENKILFKINNKPFTLVDLEKRKKYLSFVGDNENVEKQIIIDDFISANLFYEHYLRTNKNIEIKNKIDQIYKNIINELNVNNDINFSKSDKENIYYNIEIDFIRKIILEEILNSKKNEIFNKVNEIDLLYNFTIEYINVSKLDLGLLEQKLINSKNINIVEKFLKENDISYYRQEKEVNNINLINEKIKNKIMDNKKYFIIKNDTMVSFINIEKSFETLDGLIANILSIESNSKIKSENINCSYFKNINNQNIIINEKDYEYIKLNKKIQKSLIDINDYVTFSNEDKFTYVVLCGIKFNKEILNNVNVNKNISNTASIAEKKLVKEFSNKYNLVFVDE